MARWRLTDSHYLNVPGEEWEYKENDRATGREKRIRVPVPRFLDIKDPTCWTQSESRNAKAGTVQIDLDGIIVVCWEGKGEPGDIVFTGDPTPFMIPLDDEAREVSASFATRWSYKPEMAEVPYDQSLISSITAKLENPAPVEVPGLADLVAAINGLVASNAASVNRRV